jgi:hypothetical protein
MPWWGWLLISLGASPLLCCGGCGLLWGLGRLADTRADLRTAEPAYRLSANELLGGYQANEVAADQRYKGRVIEVTGVVDKVGRDILDNPYLTMQSPGIFCVQCFFDNDRPLTSLRPGHIVTVRGWCDGKLGNVGLKYCVLVR